MVLIDQARRVTIDEMELNSMSESIYALDSTTIDLCLSLFPWAEFRQHKAAIKLHTLMDLDGSIPIFIHISDGRTHDVNVLDMIPILVGSIYITELRTVDIWTAICSYLIILITQRTNQFNVKMHTMMQVLSVAIVDLMTLKQLFSDESLTEIDPHDRNYLGLFDF